MRHEILERAELPLAMLAENPDGFRSGFLVFERVRAERRLVGQTLAAFSALKRLRSFALVQLPLLDRLESRAAKVAFITWIRRRLPSSVDWRRSVQRRLGSVEDPSVDFRR